MKGREIDQTGEKDLTAENVQLIDVSPRTRRTP